MEIPFLQRTLGRFELVPIVFGDVDTAQAAKALAEIVDDRTLIVASSDLSHYFPYEVARELDRSCVDAICRLDIEAMQSQQACGRIPILVLMRLAKERGWKARLQPLRLAQSGHRRLPLRGRILQGAVAGRQNAIQISAYRVLLPEAFDPWPS